MYNRYIPQPDGSFRRNRMDDPIQRTQHRETVQKQPECPVPEPPCQVSPVHHSGAFDFLRQLLPKNLDTGDLLIIVLLLLMAGDCKEEKNTALLTLALYFFL